MTIQVANPLLLSSIAKHGRLASPVGPVMCVEPKGG